MLDPKHRNCIAPRKRPMHTLVPAMVLKDGKPLHGVRRHGRALPAHGPRLHHVATCSTTAWTRRRPSTARACSSRATPSWSRSPCRPSRRRPGGARSPRAARARCRGAADRSSMIDRANGVLIGASDPRKDGTGARLLRWHEPMPRASDRAQRARAHRGPRAGRRLSATGPSGSRASSASSGWVRNRRDGRVEAVFSGARTTVARDARSLPRGSAVARWSTSVECRGRASPRLDRRRRLSPRNLRHRPRRRADRSRSSRRSDQPLGPRRPSRIGS